MLKASTVPRRATQKEEPQRREEEQRDVADRPGGICTEQVHAWQMEPQLSFTYKCIWAWGIAQKQNTCPVGTMEALGLIIRTKKKRKNEKEKVSKSRDTGHVKFTILLVQGMFYPVHGLIRNGVWVVQTWHALSQVEKDVLFSIGTMNSL